MRKALTEALMYLVNNDPQTEHEVALAREKHPVLLELSDDQLRDFAAEIDDRVTTMVAEAAEEFEREIKSRPRMCRCLNSRCTLTVVGEDMLEARYPDPKLLETLSPGDTIPLGLCPACRGPVYQPEIFPEDEPCHGDDFCPCSDCVDPQHTDPAAPPVDNCGCRFCVAKRCALQGLTPDVTEAIVAGASDNTGAPTPGATDCSGDFTPEYQ